MKMMSLRQCVVNPTAAYPPEHILSYSANGPVTWGDFCVRIAAWEQALTAVDQACVALYQRDGAEFLATLIALWRSGKQALLPPSNLPATILAVQQVTCRFAGDFPAIDLVQFAPEVADSLALRTISAPQADRIALTLYTSGSSGAPAAVPKSFAQLDAELHSLELFRGAALAGARITGSVSHQHIYGLLFRLLWPLVSGRAFIDRERDYWEELAEDAAGFAPVAIITSPAHLNRIPPGFSLNRPAAIFSSGAPLAEQASRRASEQLGCPITEVYGSTETGGIAWREQTASTHWQCLPNVEVTVGEETRLLRIRSPHLPDHDWFTTADRAEQGDAGFSLLGRADRIVKVGGKRISLTQVEDEIRRNPWVREVRVTTLALHQDRLGAVVVLFEEGEKYRQDHGKSALNGVFRAALKGCVEPIAVPRYWRYPAELPHNSQGKVTQEALVALFEETARFPSTLGTETVGGVLRLSLQIPPKLLYFDGHFPGNPVLPGIVQVHWAVHYAREYWGDLGEFGGLEAVKFQQLILAQQDLVLELEYVAEKRKLYFCYSRVALSDPDPAESSGDRQTNFSSGRILFNSET